MEARKIRRLLVANRGEIASRILTTARELDIHTIAVYTADDANHAVYADEAILLDSPSDFMNIANLVEICVKAKVDSVHPGYGFLSESADFATELDKAAIRFVGPSAEILRRTGDKLAARNLAISNGVPVLAASTDATANIEDIQSFAGQAGYPIMIKAVDGGGGRGIRLVRSPVDLDDAFKRACGESPSGQVFVEKAAVDGYRHVEVQVLGDEHGTVTHLWERECSIQRRFQKIAELAPSTISDRRLIGKIIDGALRMAASVHYTSLGTFEFLVHESRPEYFFLEVNPRLQVEHTISEEIAGVDIVCCQLLLAQGASISSLELPDTTVAPQQQAIQLRITAEDPSKNFTLSMGRISGSSQPGGPGVRFDSHLNSNKPTIVGSSYDSLLAKLIVRASTFEGARQKALRALSDTVITGVTTNLNFLKGVVASPAFAQKQCSTTWLEANFDQIVTGGKEVDARGTIGIRELQLSSNTPEISASNAAGLGASAVLFRKGDAFKMEITEVGRANDRSAQREEFLLRIDRVLMNDFPNQLTADMTFSSASSSQPYAVKFTSTTQSSVASSKHRQASAADPTHIALPFPGQFVELLVDEGDFVKEGEVLCVVRQMKMELELRAPWAGTVKWACDVEEMETVNEGLLICELVPADEQYRRRPAGGFKL
ncbi:pyruvate carboxylase [Paraphoma chrysanthemicola]|uniref:Pyruvate carboxylase n=1 Tax=Paraphoma chrysanthemicola TaxID=798071 RepID=A0A8K0RC78_9PLEO|nr:pyruvate carboxylase [Paraphoma chrysanthemicola]